MAAEVSVLAGPPSLHRANRGYLHLVANGRAIVSRSLAHAVEQAYQGLMPAGRHPVALVRITVPPDQVDVNVHPTKAEVRFRHERLVYAVVHAAVSSARSASAERVLSAPARTMTGAVSTSSAWTGVHAPTTRHEQQRMRGGVLIIERPARPERRIRGGGGTLDLREISERRVCLHPRRTCHAQAGFLTPGSSY